MLLSDLGRFDLDVGRAALIVELGEVARIRGYNGRIFEEVTNGVYPRQLVRLIALRAGLRMVSPGLQNRLILRFNRYGQAIVRWPIVLLRLD